MKMILVAFFAASTATAALALDAEAVMKGSFKDRGQAKVDRLNQDETQALCSRYPANVPKDVAKKIEAMNLASIKYPADGKM
ncbi:MAG: sulfur oxidation c-type cytochrome SoxX, partial [Rhizobiales bacterium]|nr:sulfur oxidation c-type cytochrome SoxX [Hyphomicrobiales bacterium]